MAAPMACDAAIRALLTDMMIKCLLMSRSIGMTSLSAFLLLQNVTLASLACDLAHTSSVISSLQHWRRFFSAFMDV